MVVPVTSALIVGDIHLSDRAPSSRTAQYTEQILDKLRFASGKAKELAVPLVLAGDVFHIKSASKNSHKLVQATHEALQGVRTFIVPGNHDMSHDRLDSLNKQPLGALARMDGVSLLIGEDEELPGIAGVPYITEFDGGNWQFALYNYYNDFDIAAEEPTLLVTHAPIFPPGQAPGVYASIDPDDWADYWIGIVATYYGHIHDCHGTFMSTKETMQFCNQGALSRGSLHEESINRKPAITLWDSSNFHRIEVPHKAPEEVFLFDEAALKAVNRASAAEFAQSFETAQVAVLTMEDLSAKLRSEVSDKRVLEIIENALENVQ